MTEEEQALKAACDLVTHLNNVRYQIPDNELWALVDALDVALMKADCPCQHQHPAESLT